MIQLASDKEIGQYLRTQITARQGTQRSFVRKYLAATGESQTSENREANSLSAILSGKNGITTERLFIYAQLLGVSCEEILTAGKSHREAQSRMTNHSVAFSKNAMDWEIYLQREDTPFLFADEFNKTILDYALEYQNYPFIKYLVEKEHIRFIDEDRKNHFFVDYCIQTNFTHRPSFPQHRVEDELQEAAELRKQMIVLAIQNQDIPMLDWLHARETSEMHCSCLAFHELSNAPKQNVEAILPALAAASHEIVAYFSEPMIMHDRFGYENHFVYPYLDELANIMLKQGSQNADMVLNAIAAHNQWVYHALRKMLNQAVEMYNAKYEFLPLEHLRSYGTEQISSSLHFSEDRKIVSFHYATDGQGRNTIYDGIFTDFLNVETVSENDMEARLIRECSHWYQKIRNITIYPEEQNADTDI